jgi:beta-glucosidase
MTGRTYRFAATPPLWPFGHGLSYTTFRYVDLAIGAAAAGPEIAVSVEIENTGLRAGDEVVQVYASDRDATVPVPVRSLVAFSRVRLAAGERRRVDLAVRVDLLQVTDEDGTRRFEPGVFRFACGGIERDVVL